MLYDMIEANPNDKQFYENLKRMKLKLEYLKMFQSMVRSKVTCDAQENILYQILDMERLSTQKDIISEQNICIDRLLSELCDSPDSEKLKHVKELIKSNDELYEQEDN